MSMRVLIAIDGSSAADRAVELAGSVSWPTGTQLRVVTVVEPFEPVLAADWVRPTQETDREMAELEVAAQAALEQSARELAHTGMDISRRMMRGRPASQIIENARDFAVDLIIVGNRGHGTIASMILGSVSAEVVDHAPCPVLVVRRSRITRAVLGHDGSPFARSAESVLADWPIFEKVAIDVTSVAQLGPPWASGLALSAYEPPAAVMAETMEAIIGERREIAERAAGNLRDAGRQVSACVVRGDAAAELIRVAERDEADLIVVGTHGRTGLARLVLGSVARNVMVHAPCSVLVVRQPEVEPG